MKFSELLKAATDAAAHRTATKEGLAEAQEALVTATTWDEEATIDEAAAHAAICERLAGKGHHSIRGEDGTISIFQLNPNVPEGWSSYHPIPGEDA